MPRFNHTELATYPPEGTYVKALIDGFEYKACYKLYKRPQDTSPHKKIKGFRNYGRWVGVDGERMKHQYVSSWEYM